MRLGHKDVGHDLQNDNVVLRAQMRYLCAALHYPGNLWMSLRAFEPGREPFSGAVPAKGWRHDAAAVRCPVLESGCMER